MASESVRVAVLDDYQHAASRYADWASLGPDVEVSFFHDHLGTPAEVVAALAPFQVVCLMRERTVFGAGVITQLPSLEMIVTTGMVNASLDVDAAIARGIAVCGTEVPGPETAEHAFLLIASVLNGFLADVAGVGLGDWQTGVGRRIQGSTLGLLGLGNLGAKVATYAKVFGMELLAWSQNLTDERAAEVGVERAEGLNDLFERSDVVSIHLKLSDRSRGLVTAKQLTALGPDGYLVNTSRGPIVVEEDLVQALSGGTIAGAALDTFDIEPLPSGHPLRHEPRALVTPHTAYVSRESYSAMYAQTVEDIAAWRADSPVRRIG